MYFRIPQCKGSNLFLSLAQYFFSLLVICYEIRNFFFIGFPKKAVFFLLLLFSRDVHGQLFFLFDQLMHDENSCWCHQMKKLIFFLSYLYNVLQNRVCLYVWMNFLL